MKVDESRTSNALSETPTGLRRRSFLGWGSWAAVLVPGSAAWTLVACGGSDEAAQDAGATPPPSPDPVVIENPAALSISIQARQVQWVAGKSPAQANAWVYRRRGGTPASGVLGNQLGPYLNVRRNSPCAVTWSQHHSRVDAGARATGSIRPSTCRSTSACAGASSISRQSV